MREITGIPDQWAPVSINPSPNAPSRPKIGLKASPVPYTAGSSPPPLGTDSPPSPQATHRPLDRSFGCPFHVLRVVVSPANDYQILHAPTDVQLSFPQETKIPSTKETGLTVGEVPEGLPDGLILICTLGHERHSKQ